MNNKNDIKKIAAGILIFWFLIVIYFYFKNEGHSVFLLFFEFKNTVLLDVLYVFYLSVIAFYSGKTLRTLLKCKSCDEGFLLRYVTSTTTGFGIIAILTFFLGLFGLYTMTAILSMHFVLLLCSIGELRKTLEWSQKNQFKINKEFQISTFSLFLVIMLTAMILMRLCGSLSPPFGDDGQWYHLGIPLDYLAKGKFFPILSKPAGAFPQNFEMLSLNCLVVSSDISVSFLNFYIGLLLLGAVYCLFRDFVNPKLALLLSVIFYSEPTIQFINTEIKNDQFITLAITLSFYYFFNFMKYKDKKCLALTAVFWGIALGTKYTALNLLLFFIAASAFILYKETRDDWHKVFAKMLIICFIFSGAWYVKNIIVYKTPIAPFYKNFFFWINNSPKTPESKNSKNPAASNNASIDTPVQKQKNPYVDLVSFYGMGRKPMDYLKIPWNLTIHGKRGTSVFDSTVSPLYLALFPFLFFAWKDKKSRFLLFVFCGQFAAWALQESQNSRYLVISLPAVIMIIGIGIDNIDFRIIRKIILSVSAIIILLFTFMEFQYFVYEDAQPYRYVFNLESRDTYLKRVTSPLYGAAALLKQQWTQDKNIRAYYVGTRSNYFFRESSAGDYNLRRVSEIVTYGVTPEGMREYLKEHGINRVLIEYKMLTYFYTRSEERKAEYRKFLEFRDKYLKEIYMNKGRSQQVGVYEVM